jgi:hypothetical protein
MSAARDLPPVSTTQGKLVAKFAAFVVDIGGNLLVSLIPAEILPPVLLTPVVHLDLCIQYISKCSKKFEMTLLFFPGAWGKVIHEKNLKQKTP